MAATVPPQRQSELVGPPARSRRAVQRARAEARSAVHWTVAHGVPRVALRAAARSGDLHGRLVVAASTGAVGEVLDLVEEVRAHGPLHRSRLAYVTADHAVVREVLTHSAFRSGLPGRTDGPLARLAQRTASEALHPVQPPSLLVTEPPDHTRYRKLVNKVFTVRAVEGLRARTEEIADRLLDSLDPTGPVELVDAYCSLLPVTVIAEILGVRPADRGLVLELGAAAAASLDLGLPWRVYRSVDAALTTFDRWLADHLHALRAAPGDDLLSQLVTARDDGAGLTERELRATAGLVLVAGFETTVNLLGNGVALLSGDPRQLEVLRARPELWPNAVDEVLRIDPPVMMTGRTCAQDTTVAGVPVRAGAAVTTLLAGANRDPAVFTDPGRFDVTRENAREHLSFSAGRHFCLGAALARMEGEVGLRRLFDRFPDLRREPGARRRPTRILRGYEALPVRLR